MSVAKDLILLAAQPDHRLRLTYENPTAEELDDIDAIAREHGGLFVRRVPLTTHIEGQRPKLVYVVTRFASSVRITESEAT